MKNFTYIYIITMLTVSPAIIGMNTEKAIDMDTEAASKPPKSSREKSLVEEAKIAKATIEKATIEKSPIAEESRHGLMPFGKAKESQGKYHKNKNYKIVGRKRTGSLKEVNKKIKTKKIARKRTQSLGKTRKNDAVESDSGEEKKGVTESFA